MALDFKTSLDHVISLETELMNMFMLNYVIMLYIN